MSYAEIVVNIFRIFRVIHHMRCLQTNGFVEKFHRVDKDSIRFGATMVVKLEFDFATFSISNEQPRL
jgi:hypothetical protein